MNSEEYADKAVSTVSNNFDTNHVSLEDFEYTMLAMIEMSKAIDYLKRSLFYGKKLDREKLVKSVSVANMYMQSILGNEYVPTNISFDNKDKMLDKLIHASFGFCTESGEVLETMYKHLCNTDKELDWKNIFEEIGDINWYIPLFLQEAKNQGKNWSFEKIWDLNIDKLSKRYPNKFETEKCYNRNSKKELEKFEDIDD